MRIWAEAEVSSGTIAGRTLSWLVVVVLVGAALWFVPRKKAAPAQIPYR